MNKMALATKYVYTFEDGETCEMTLAFIRLKALSSKNKNLYDRYNKIMANGVKEELEGITILYTAYVCANLDAETLLTEDEFIEKCGSDREEPRKALQRLISPKKQ